MKSLKFQNFNFHIISSIYIYDKYAIFEIQILIMKKNPPNFNGNSIFFS